MYSVANAQPAYDRDGLQSARDAGSFSWRLPAAECILSSLFICFVSKSVWGEGKGKFLAGIKQNQTNKEEKEKRKSNFSLSDLVH